MADTIRIKRRVSGDPGPPASLANGELAFNEVDRTLYYGTALAPIAIAGPGAFAPLDSPPLSGAPTAPTPATSDNDTSIATTAYVKAVVAGIPGGGGGGGSGDFGSNIAASPTDLSQHISLYGSATGFSVSAMSGWSQVATRCRLMTHSYTGGTLFNARSYHYARGAVTSLRVVYGGWYTNISGGFNLDIDSVGSAVIRASVEYPVGTFTQIRWGGAVEAAFPHGGGLLISDPVSVAIPKDAKFYIRRYFNGTGSCYIEQSSFTPATQLTDLTGGDATSFDSGDLTMGGTIVDSGSFAPAPPLAILAQTSHPSFALVGDSRVQGAGDIIEANVGDSGELARGIGLTHGYINMGVWGDTLALYLEGNNSRRRRALIQFCTHVVSELGINDVESGVSVATMKANIGVLRNLAEIRAKSFYHSTYVTETTSTDGWATTANQTVSGFEAQRLELNTWIRGGGDGLFTGYVDPCPAVENTPGIWKAPGYTVDGIHESQTAFRAIQSAGVTNGMTSSAASNSRLNFVSDFGVSQVFVIGGADIGSITDAGLNAMPIGQLIPAPGGFTSVRTGSTTGPTWTSGTGAPSTVQPAGSLYSRSNGAVGTRLYVSNGATWASVAGV